MQNYQYNILIYSVLNTYLKIYKEFFLNKCLNIEYSRSTWFTKILKE